MASFSKVLFLFIFSIFSVSIAVGSSPQSPPVLFNVENLSANKLPTCSKSSPEVFFYNIAQPSLSLLYHRCKALFGILMDEIEASFSISDASEDLKNKTKEQWSYIANSVTVSFDSAVDRLETEWEYFIIVADSPVLPWEATCKLPLIHEIVARIEYGYLMVEAVVKTGIKEIVGTLQHQLTDVIKKLEDEVAKKSQKHEEVTEIKLLKKMKHGLSQIKSSFSTKLLQRVVDKALEGHTHSKKRPPMKTFLSESLDQMAILIHAFREKGLHYPDFWTQMSAIYEKEFDISSATDINSEIENFLLELMKNQDKLISLIVEIISRENS